MKKYLLLLLLFGVLCGRSFGQIYTDMPTDSFVIDFSAPDTNYFIPDTAMYPLWQTGRTHKSFFSTDTETVSGIMTDTTAPYPVDADNWFAVKISRWYTNPTLYIWHKYQTDTGKDGGVIEFTLDNGVTWLNVVDSCNIDSAASSGYVYEGILTIGLYVASDTIEAGDASFTGTCDTSRLTVIQFYTAPPIKSTAGWGCDWWRTDSIYVRFRFVSDTDADTLAGWKIDSLKVVYYSYSGSVNDISNPGSVKVFPNPSHSGVFAVETERVRGDYTMQVFDVFGREVWRSDSPTSIDLSGFPPGVYVYTVRNADNLYRGMLQVE